MQYFVSEKLTLLDPFSWDNHALGNQKMSTLNREFFILIYEKFGKKDSWYDT